MRTAYLPEIASGAMKLDVATRAATKTIAVGRKPNGIWVR